MVSHLPHPRKGRLTLREVLLVHIRHQPDRVSPATITVVFLRVGRDEIQIALDFLPTCVEPIVQLCFDLLQVHGVVDYRVIPKDEASASGKEGQHGSGDAYFGA